MGKKAVDILYVLGEGSCWNNNEIRFSLRSVEKNRRNFRKVFIVGSMPKFLKNVIHIPVQDIYNPAINPDGNIIHKVLQACKDDRLSNDFLFMNDDYLVLKPVDASTIPAYHKGDCRNFSEKYFTAGFWRTRLERTYKELRDRGLSTFHYDGHVPILMNKNWFPEIMKMFDYGKGKGYTMKSLYGNMVYGKGAPIGSVKKVIFKPYRLEEYDQKFSDCTFASVNDHGMTPYYKRWVYSKFPDASSFEKDPENKSLTALKWFNSDRDIDTGISIYQQYGPSGNVKKYFQRHRYSLKIQKLEKHMHKLI